MSDPGNLAIKDFTYALPEKRIARYPLSERDESKLLVYDQGIISEDKFFHIGTHIPDGSLMVFNDTKVVEARLLFQKPSGGVIEIFCLEPHRSYTDITLAMNTREKVYWNCMIGGASKWKKGQILSSETVHDGRELVLQARYMDKLSGSFNIELSWNDTSLSFADILHLFGAVPLPPYIRRAAESADAERYQTIYAHYEGSVAAPTAGLHFTNRIFERLKKRKIDAAYVTLHVGAGTFKPVKSERMKDHDMHFEHFAVDRGLIELLLSHVGEPVLAVGTTALRTIESLYWTGIMLLANQDPGEGIDQWFPYRAGFDQFTPREALLAVLNMMRTKNIDRYFSKTGILIAPGYRCRLVNGLVTNFHQPQSTLLLLVAACIGQDWKKVYEYALQNDFRFLSYGDASLLWFLQD